MNVSLPAARYFDAAPRRAIYDRMLSAVRALPGVEHAATTSMLPLTGQGQVNFIVPEGSAVPRSEQPTANFRFVAPEFTQTLGLSLRRGRLFTAGERDQNRPAPVLISEYTAARLWPDHDPIGKRFSRGIEQEQGFEVVGVVADARLTSLERMPPYMVYVPYWWRSYPTASLLIKTSAEPLSIVPAIRTAIRQIDAEIAVGEGRSLERPVADSLSGRQYQMRLFLAFGAVGLLIATTGVFAVTAYGVSRRRREMNIRAALGARPGQLLGMIVRQTGQPIAFGLAGGIFGALAMGGLVARLLFGISARDPVVLIGISLLVGMTGLGAAVAAAHRSLTLEPAVALRDE
jgi:predicted permease